MKVGVVMPIGPAGRHRRGPPVGGDARGGAGHRRGGPRLRLGLRPPALPLRDRSHPGHPRVLDGPVRHGRHHLAGRAGDPGAGHALPESGTAGQDGRHLRGRFGWQADPGRWLRLERARVHRLRLPLRSPRWPFRGGAVDVGAGGARGARLLRRAVALRVRPRDPAGLLAAGRTPDADADCRPRAADAAAGRPPRRCLEHGLDRAPRRSCRRGSRASMPPWPRPDATPPRSRSRSASTWCCPSTRTRTTRRWRSRPKPSPARRRSWPRSCEPTRTWASAISRSPWNRPRRRPSATSARRSRSPRRRQPYSVGIGSGVGRFARTAHGA